MLILKANALHANWGQSIFQTANEYAANIDFRKHLDEIQAQTDSEKEWWEKRRASIAEEFKKELDNPVLAAKSSPSAKTSTSDEDTVLVEADGSATNSTGSIRKKKGKK
jgi:translocation protein SEC66